MITHYPTYAGTNHDILFNKKENSYTEETGRSYHYQKLSNIRASAKSNQPKHNKSMPGAHQVQFCKPGRILGKASGEARTLDVGLDVGEHVSCGTEWILSHLATSP